MSSKNINLKVDSKMNLDLQNKQIKRSNSDKSKKMNTEKKKRTSKFKSLQPKLLNIKNNNNIFGINGNFIPNN